MRTRCLFVLAAATAIVSCSQPRQAAKAPSEAAPPRRPNIVMVLVDDMRWDEMRVAVSVSQTS